MKLVVFDVDGTLVDSEAQIFAAQRRAFISLGLEPPSREACRQTIGLSLEETFRRLAAHECLAEKLLDAYRTARAEMRIEGNAEMPFQGASEMLASLSSWPGFRLAVATGKHREGVDRTLKRWGWDTYFTTVQTADDAPSKPDPGMLMNCLRECNLPAYRAVMIGDTTFDYEMARRAHVQFIGVTWGNHSPEVLAAAGATTIASDFGDLLQRLHTFMAHG